MTIEVWSLVVCEYCGGQSRRGAFFRGSRDFGLCVDCIDAAWEATTPSVRPWQPSGDQSTRIEPEVARVLEPLGCRVIRSGEEDGS